MSIVELGDGLAHVPSEVLIVEVGRVRISPMKNPHKSGRKHLQNVLVKFATYRSAGVTPPYARRPPLGGSGLLRGSVEESGERVKTVCVTIVP